jgi:TM2 domain-containing membrane protein YozV
MSSIPYPNAQAVFYQQYESVRRDEVVGVLLALFLGCFGVHHFYLRRTGLGILYCCFFWTGITALLGLVECFFMPSRVREFNAIQAAGIAAALGIGNPIWTQPVNITVNMPPGAQTASAPQMASGLQTAALTACPQCQRANPPSARFCGGCGATL